MDNSLVFNTTYKSLAAEWLGLSTSPNHASKKDPSPNVEKQEDEEIDDDTASKQTHVSKTQRDSKSKPLKHGKNKKKTEEEKSKTSLEVGEKLQKKLTKARKRAHERNTEFSLSIKKSSKDDSDEESKFDVVKKPRVEKGGKEEGKNKALTAQDIQKRLKDPTLSKPARKRLKKKLKALGESSGDQVSTQGRQALPNKNQTSKVKRPDSGKSEAKLKRKEIEEFSKSFTDQMSTGALSSTKKKLPKHNNVSIDNSQDESDSDVPDDSSKNFTKVKKVENVHQFPSKKKKNRKKSLFSEAKDSKHKHDKSLHEKKKVNSVINGANDHVKKDENVADTNTEDKGSAEKKKKKKRPKKRSKQKNIKKDHRPDEMKPSYMQGAGMKRVSIKTVAPRSEDKESRQS